MTKVNKAKVVALRDMTELNIPTYLLLDFNKRRRDESSIKRSK